MANSTQAAITTIYKTFAVQDLAEGELEGVMARAKTLILDEWNLIAKDLPAVDGEPECFVGRTTRAPFHVTMSVVPTNVPVKDRIEVCEWIERDAISAYKRACAHKRNLEIEQMSWAAIQERLMHKEKNLSALRLAHSR